MIVPTVGLEIAESPRCGPRRGVPASLDVVSYTAADRTGGTSILGGTTYDGASVDEIWIGVTHSESDIERVFFFWDSPYVLVPYHDVVQPWSNPGFVRGDQTVPMDLLGGPSDGDAVGLDIKLDPASDPRSEARESAYVADGVHRLDILIGMDDKTYYSISIPVTITNSGSSSSVTPGVPTGLTLSDAVDNQLTASWTASANAVAYEVTIGVSSPPTETVVEVTGTSYTTGFLATDSVRNVQVRAKSSTGTYSAKTAVVGPETVTGPAAGTIVTRVPYYSGANAFMRASSQKGSNTISVDDVEQLTYFGNSSSTVDSDVLWPRFGLDWGFFTKDKPSGWGNNTQNSIDESVTKATQNLTPTSFIRKVQMSENGGWGSTMDPDDYGLGATVSIMGAPTKLNSKPFNQNGKRIYNNRTTAIELAAMADGFYSNQIKAVAQAIVDSTSGGLAAGSWVERVVVSIFNECNAPWFSNYIGIDPWLADTVTGTPGTVTGNGDPKLLNPTIANTGYDFSAGVKQLLINLATPGYTPYYEVLGHVPDGSLDDDDGKRQMVYDPTGLVDVGQGFSGDRSVLAAAAANRIIDDMREVDPGIITNINYAHSGANPDGLAGEGDFELERTINWRFHRLVTEGGGTERISMIDIDWYCRSSLAPSSNGATNWQDYSVDGPGGLAEAIAEAKAAMTVFNLPFGSREYGICRKYNPSVSGVGCTDKAAAKFMDYLEHPTTGVFNSADFPVAIIYPYNAKNQTGSKRNIRYNFNETEDPELWEVAKVCRPGRGEDLSSFYGET